MSGFLRGCLVTGGVGVLMVATVVGGTFVLLSQPSPLAPEFSATSGPYSPIPGVAPQPPEGHPNAQFQRQQTVTPVQVTQEGINAVIARGLPHIRQQMEAQGTPFVAEYLNVVLQPERILIASRVVALGYHTSLDVAARPGIQEGKLRVVVEEAYLGRIPLPGAIAGQLSGLLDSGLEQLLPRDLPLDKLRLKVDRGVLTLERAAP